MIHELNLDKVLEIRQRVMYPMQTVEEMRLPADDEGWHLAYWVNNKPVSVISVFREWDEWQFRKFATETEFQGQGYGTQLLSYVMEAAEQAGVKRIWCNARLSATALYKRMGMEEAGESWTKNNIDFIIMERKF